MNSILNNIQSAIDREKDDIALFCVLRECFDTSCSQWNHSTIYEKIEVLRKLIKEARKNTLKLFIGMA